MDFPFNARDTVAVDTPARAATSLMVATYRLASHLCEDPTPTAIDTILASE
ncbi:hypothetical protein JCM33774_43990 [Actinophytocola sp. KF-1]